MKLEASLLSNQMVEALHGAPIAIFVSALDTRELLYANRAAKELFEEEFQGELTSCYRAAGFDEPCSFCRADRIGTQPFVREFHHPANDRYYQLSGKRIEWDGKPAHIEYIVDITEKKREIDRQSGIRAALQDTFSSIPCGLAVYRCKGEHILPEFHNLAFYEIMGYSEEHARQLERETNYLNVHPQDLDVLRGEVQRAIQSCNVFEHTYRVWNDRRESYCWIRLEGSVKTQGDGSKLLYGVYSDVSKQMSLEGELTETNEKMQDIINAIPGGVAIYKVSDIFETVYFSDGVPELSGYTVEEYQKLIREDAAKLTYSEDSRMVVENLRRAIREQTVANFDFRKIHRNGHIVWVHIQARQIGRQDGFPLIQCVFHNITDLKEAQLEMDHLVNSIPGGIASYRIEGGNVTPSFYSDGVPALSGRTREEFDELVRKDACDMIYALDRKRVLAAARAAIESGEVLNISYRMHHRDGRLIWIHLNGRRMGPLAETTWFYAVFTGMSAETRLFQDIANEAADGIYVIDRENYDLLYANEKTELFAKGGNVLGRKCYAALHGKSEPCEFCTLKTHVPDGREHEIAVGAADRFYTARCRMTDWNGVPAYIQYIRDVTKEVKIRRDKERLEKYFQTMVKNLPSGVAVVHYEKDGSMKPEFLSDGFASMTGMTLEQAWKLYRHDAMAGVHPDDRRSVREQMERYIESGDSQCEIVYRIASGKTGYVWVKNTLSLIQNEGGESRVYAVYHDITREREERRSIRQRYNELLMQHYRTPGPDALIVGHCNITRNQILEINDYTGLNLLETLGTVREDFFNGLSHFVVDAKQREKFLLTYLGEPSLSAFTQGITERCQEYFIHLPNEPCGRYAQVKMNMVATPDSGDVTGILMVTDITERTMSERVLHQLSVAGNDFVMDVDLSQDSYKLLSQNEVASHVPLEYGCYSKWIAAMAASKIVPRDRQAYLTGLNPDRILERLQSSGPYTFAYSVEDDGSILTKNMTVSAIDLRLKRICLSRTDITDSVREQQALLRVIAYTFEIAGFIDLSSGKLTLYTRETVLENLPPHYVEHYGDAIVRFASRYIAKENREDVLSRFQIGDMLGRLAERPAGYDFLFVHRDADRERYKQVNVLWGDTNHRTLCLVRADVTDMLAAEQRTKKELRNALAQAQEANRAKSDFLSTMSHDIRTPMNAIMGMTALAVAHMDDRDRVADCLAKISVSSRHLLSLINDILDMSKIESNKLSISCREMSISELTQQLADMIGPQAGEAGLALHIRTDLRHECFYGDSLRMNQILINLLSNAVKFTPEGGSIDFSVEEIAPLADESHVRYRFVVSDTGIGMSEDFQGNLFAPFTRSGTTERVEGTGLGLSIVKGLVELMGGKITVKSSEGVGSTFSVELEFEPAQDDTCAGRAISAPSGQRGSLFAGRHFLVVEDNAINAEILCELLAMHGAHCVVKTDGLQAVHAFSQTPQDTYDAILMDIQMPQMNGYEATRAIRAMDRADAATIPIVAMTANAFAEDVQASLNAGMNAHVSKPIDTQVLESTLRQVLRV
ncbi:hybrid sensor histidine kinase/response regulator [Feifania hominis]|uniref:Circadian input-output histidine kinase CikA n=1 Tax=Feifania hominis TaxID=2763660 RepID=A0A926DCD3_9FIRM|nr:hybrid sensor histidine kinase/response regulator [Feifania hominis]MBC8535257.1 PAS domain-containing protein [Feifania hominis]